MKTLHRPCAYLHCAALVPCVGLITGVHPHMPGGAWRGSKALRLPCITMLSRVNAGGATHQRTGCGKSEVYPGTCCLLPLSIAPMSCCTAYVMLYGPCHAVQATAAEADKVDVTRVEAEKSIAVEERDIATRQLVSVQVNM